MNTFFDQEEKKQANVTLDFKRVLARAIRFWYVVVLSLGIAFTVAFYKTRYSQRIYPVSASIMIREMQETGGAELLYKNALIDPYRNYLNEPYIIRSYPLIEKVVRSLNFHVTFFQEGYLKTSDAYSFNPVRARWCGPDKIQPGRYIFTIKDANHYTITEVSSGSGQRESDQFAIGDSIQFGQLHLCVERIQDRTIDPFIGSPFLLLVQDPVSVASSYVGRLNVEWAAEGAGVINLSLTGTNPDKEIDFLKNLILHYRQADLDKKNETAERTIEFIREQLRGIKDSLKIVEFKLQRFGNSSRVKDMSEEAQRLLAKTETFEIQKAELLIRQNYYQYLDAYLEKSESQIDQVILPSSMGISDPILSSLLNKMVDLQLEIKMYVAPERVSNPVVTSKIERIREIRREVQEAIRSLRSTDKIKMNFIDKQISSTEKQLEMLPVSERQLIAVQRNYSLLENLYVFLMQKLSEAGISKASNTSDIIPVNPPMQGGIISPKPIQNYSIAAIFGLVVPMIIFILFELVNNKIQSKEDIDKMSSIPFIGGVGHNSTGNNLTVIDRPKSGIAESFRALRSNLNFFTGNQTKKVFMVTSSISGEGKTFTTINLATVFALSGKKTLIVGADMRRPKIFQDFGRNNDHGLSTYLSGIDDFGQIVQDTSIENLFLVSGGPVPPNPSELLLTTKFESFIKQAIEKFDFVLIDTPPLALVTDAFVMSNFANHTVFVMRQNFSPKDFVRSIDEYYRSGKIKNISILLNDIYKSGLGYGYGQGYAYQYGYAYGYGAYGRKNAGGYYSDES